MPPQHVVFYSWQSDRGPNRGLIETALNDATEQLRADETLSIDVVVDRDTAGIGGSPSIPATIFEKIDRAALFVADVTFINDGASERLCPNPNVLVELGYAAKALGWERVITVMNTHYGPPEALPFDLRHRRTIPFTAVPGVDNSVERRRLTSVLRDAIQNFVAALPGVSTPPPEQLAIDAIASERPSRLPIVRAFSDEVGRALVALSPDLQATDWRLDEFQAALAHARPVISGFASVARIAAQHSNKDAAQLLFRVIEQCAQGRYDLEHRVGAHVTYEDDYWNFVILELQLALVAAFVAEERYQIAGEILREPCFVGGHSGGGNLPLSGRSQRVQRLCVANRQSAAPIGEFLRERYRDGQPVSFDDIVAADFFHLIAAGVEDGPFGHKEPAWYPPTWLLTERMPRFLTRLTSRRYLAQLAEAVGLPAESLKDRITEVLCAAPSLFGPQSARMTPSAVRVWDSSRIGNEP